jgi:alkaline phosphatase
MSKNPKFLMTILMALILTASIQVSYADTLTPAKHIILFIGDGKGLIDEIALSRYLYGSDYGLIWDTFPYKTYVTTWDATTYGKYSWNLNGSRYDTEEFRPAIGYDLSKGGSKSYPEERSHDDYFLTKLSDYGSTYPHKADIPSTDSASSGTAMATGIKTDNGNVAWLKDDPPDGTIRTIAELIREKKNASIGVVSTVPFTHATPATFVSHNIDRDNFYTGINGYTGKGIADEIIRDIKPEVVIGGGHPMQNNPEWDTTKGYISHTLYDELHESKEYVFSERQIGMDGAETLYNDTDIAISQNRKLFGLFGGNNGNFEPPVPVDMPGKPAFYRTINEDPLLKDATIAALKVLNRDRDGFFLMIEGGDIDWANHVNNYQMMIGTMWEFNEAVKTAIEYVDQPGDVLDWNNTLLIVTSDHSTGHMRFNDSLNLGIGDLPRQEKVTAPLTGPWGHSTYWKYPDGEVTYYASDHTNELVPLYAIGKTASLFKKYEGQWYPGTTIIDNTHIYSVMADASGLLSNVSQIEEPDKKSSRFEFALAAAVLIAVYMFVLKRF